MYYHDVSVHVAGTLVLHLTKDTFQALGLEGKASVFGNGTQKYGMFNLKSKKSRRKNYMYVCKILKNFQNTLHNVEKSKTRGRTL